jgi:hypothetical protein
VSGGSVGDARTTGVGVGEGDGVGRASRAAPTPTPIAATTSRSAAMLAYVTERSGGLGGGLSPVTPSLRAA